MHGKQWGITDRCRTSRNGGCGWRKLADFIPDSDRERTVYVVADLYGCFRLPASRVPEVLDSELWTHEVYVAGSDVDWLMGIKQENVFLQGKTAAWLWANS